MQSDLCDCACRCLYKPTKPFKEFLENVVAGRQGPAVLEEPEKVGRCLLGAGAPAPACSVMPLSGRQGPVVHHHHVGCCPAENPCCCLLRLHRLQSP